MKGRFRIEAGRKQHVAHHGAAPGAAHEHLAGATASLTENLLAACPALTVLATSREALGVEGELSWQVPPLSPPKPGPGSDLTASAWPDRTRSSCSSSGPSWSGRRSGLPTRTRLAAPAFASTQSSSGYQFRTLNDHRDMTFNQLLGINNEGVIAGYFGSGAKGHPNKGVDQLLGADDHDVAVGFYTNAQGGEAGPGRRRDQQLSGDVAGFYAKSSSVTDAFLLLHSGRCSSRWPCRGRR